MAHFVYECEDGSFISTRKNTGRVYECRVTTSETLDNARIFNTKGAATNAGNQAGKESKTVRVGVMLL